MKIHVSSIEFCIEDEEHNEEFITIIHTAEVGFMVDLKIPGDANATGKEDIWIGLNVMAEVIRRATALFALQEAGRA